ncbi:MAG TPA: response regulator, partial [Deltaproteobacteria bacterium]|nr:response regulator [Deltaproteobacteria bacterium]
MKRILVIDNHPVMLKYMTNLLEREGHQVKTAEDGLSALDILETYVPDIIFCDMVMPRIDGEKLCRIVRSMPALKDVFFVIVSGVAAESEIDFRGFGADLCIAKGPFNVMSEHVLNVLSEPKRDALLDRAGEILGLESIYPRSVAKELWRSKRHFEVILDHMSEGMLELTSDRRIVYVNPSTISLTGMVEERILGTDFINLFHESHKQSVREVVEAIDDRPLKIHEIFPLLVNCKQVSLYILPVRDEDRLLYVVIMTDIGEKRVAEARLQQALKTEAIATLAGGIAHDYNNLLAIIMGNLSMAQEEIDPHSLIGGLLHEIEQASFKARDLTHQFLTLSQGGYPRKERGSIESLLKAIQGEAQAHEGIEYAISIQDDLWPVEYDSRQMHYAITNVFTNAMEAMPQGGTVTIQAENKVIENKDKKFPLLLDGGKYVRISIRDEGKGIPEEHLKQIFDPYFSTKERGEQKGMGMGLTTA